MRRVRSVSTLAASACRRVHRAYQVDTRYGVAQTITRDSPCAPCAKMHRSCTLTLAVFVTLSQPPQARVAQPALPDEAATPGRRAASTVPLASSLPPRPPARTVHLDGSVPRAHLGARTAGKEIQHWMRSSSRLSPAVVSLLYPVCVHATLVCSCPRNRSAGTFATTGSGSCTNCIAGRFSASVSSSCTDCVAGKVSSTRAASCTDCPAGRFSPTAALELCTDCVAGRFSTGAASVCTVCPVGKFGPTVALSACLTCVDGTSSVSGALSCTCAAGRYYAIPAQAPSNVSCPVCDIGKYQPQLAQAR